jgi:hypothetical protein
MPAESKSEFRFMQAVKNDPAFAAKVGVPQSVGAEFGLAKAGGYKSLPLHVKPKGKKK